MNSILFWTFIFISLCIFIYSAYQYYHSPLRYLRKAKKNSAFFILDDVRDPKKNLQFVYKGCQFDAEKYIGSTDKSFVILSIHIQVKEPAKLIGFTTHDILYLENKLRQSYPQSDITWHDPINQLLKKESSFIN